MAGDILAGLNDEQLAVATFDRNAIVIAGPGSGKTHTLARKAARQLADPNRRLAAVTFTREGAMELRERIVRFAGEEAIPRLLVGTFHSVMQMMSFPSLYTGSFATEIMAGARSGFGKRKWRIVNEPVRRSYIMRAMQDLGIDADIEFEDASKIIEHVKSGKNPEQLIHEQLVAAYTEIMERNQVIDFQDILLKTLNGLKEGHVSPLNVTDLFIDEYQDTDDVQFTWAGYHYRPETTMTAVGDDDQSIYAFRNALGYEGMLRFASEFNAEKLMLGRNYRCREEVLTPSINVIRNNQGRIDKHLVAHKGKGGESSWQSFKSRNDEAFAVADFAFEALRKGASIGVLARTNRRLDEVEAVLSARGIPYRRPPGESILNKPEIDIFGTALRTIIDPKQSAVETLLHWNGVLEGDLRALGSLFKGSLVVGSAEDFKKGGVSDQAKDKWREFVKRFVAWQRILEGGQENLLIHGVHEWLVSTAKDASVLKMLDIAKEIHQPRRAGNGREAQSIKDRLASIKRLQDDRKEQQESKETVVELMTAHGSKGLEFDRVCIIGVETDTWPAKDGALEEERRLMYVAMTRAKEILKISTGGSRPPSLFIEESGVVRIIEDEDVEEAAA